MTKSVLLPLLLLIVSVCFSQQKIMQGQVNNKIDHDLPGVTIKIVNMNFGTTSDGVGLFTLKISQNQTLSTNTHFSMKNYLDVHVKWHRLEAGSIKSKSSLNNLNDVTAIGNSPVRKALIGSVFFITAHKFKKVNLNSAKDAQNGRFPDVQVAGLEGSRTKTAYPTAGKNRMI